MIDDVVIEPGTARPGLGQIPSHKITITSGSDIYVFWYLKADQKFRDFDKLKDMNLVKLMHAKGAGMNIGRFESFSTQPGSDYHLARIGSHEFTIKVLRQ